MFFFQDSKMFLHYFLVCTGSNKKSSVFLYGVFFLLRFSFIIIFKK